MYLQFSSSKLVPVVHIGITLHLHWHSSWSHTWIALSKHFFLSGLEKNFYWNDYFNITIIYLLSYSFLHSQEQETSLYSCKGCLQFSFLTLQPHLQARCSSTGTVKMLALGLRLRTRLAFITFSLVLTTWRMKNVCKHFWFDGVTRKIPELEPRQF